MNIGAPERGAGLVESLIAVAILGTALVAAISALSTGSLAVRVAGQDTMAQSLARTNLEAIKAISYNETGTYSAVIEPGYDVSIDFSPIADNITKVTVTVSRDGATLLAVEDYKVNR
ncbi:MAG: hypothetical protein HYX85_02580 [Chloroflexi bacterium]|nr:hypothetical protein [Chloroflexota bacterium]